MPSSTLPEYRRTSDTFPLPPVIFHSIVERFRTLRAAFPHPLLADARRPRRRSKLVSRAKFVHQTNSGKVQTRRFRKSAKNHNRQPFTSLDVSSFTARRTITGNGTCHSWIHARASTCVVSVSDDFKYNRLRSRRLRAQSVTQPRLSATHLGREPDPRGQHAVETDLVQSRLKKRLDLNPCTCGTAADDKTTAPDDVAHIHAVRRKQ
jgi:hypothetical protein